MKKFDDIVKYVVYATIVMCLLFVPLALVVML